MQCPLNPHWKSVKRILRYLAGIKDYGLTLHKSSHLNLTGYSHSDWATDVDDRRSTLLFCACVGTNLITWCPKKQPTVSRSSTEAEDRCLAHITAEILWLKSLLHELRIC